MCDQIVRQTAINTQLVSWTVTLNHTITLTCEYYIVTYLRPNGNWYNINVILKHHDRLRWFDGRKLILAQFLLLLSPTSLLKPEHIVPYLWLNGNSYNINIILLNDPKQHPPNDPTERIFCFIILNNPKHHAKTWSNEEDFLLHQELEPDKQKTLHTITA